MSHLIGQLINGAVTIGEFDSSLLIGRILFQGSHNVIHGAFVDRTAEKVLYELLDVVRQADTIFNPG